MDANSPNSFDMNRRYYPSRNEEHILRLHLPDYLALPERSQMRNKLSHYVSLFQIWYGSDYCSDRESSMPLKYQMKI